MTHRLKCSILVLVLRIQDNLILEVTRAKNGPKCTCLYFNNFQFHDLKLTQEHLVSLDSGQIFIDCVYLNCVESDVLFIFL